MYNTKRTEKLSAIKLPEAGIPQAVSEAHLDFVLTLVEEAYDYGGANSLHDSMWTDLLVDYANMQGMQVDKETLIDRVKIREESEEKGNFFTDLRDAVLEMRTGLTADKNIRVIDSYVA